MQISYHHKFIFIHIYKTAGSSIDEALKDYAFNPNHLLIDKVLRKLHLHWLPFYRYRNFHRHMPARKIKGILPEEIYNSFFKFAFVRNPWDWQVSLFHYAIQSPEHYQHQLHKSKTGFDEYIEWRVNGNARLQKDFIFDDQGNQIVDFIGKFEQLNEDFQRICQALKIEASLSHLNRSKHRDYRSYYNANTRQLIKNHFAEDIEFFGYDFDGVI